MKIQEINTKNNQKTHCGQEISEIDYQMICTVCGIIHYEIFKNNYINFYENMYRKKSIYIRKNHINVLNEISLSNKKLIPSFVFNNVLKMFDKIKNVLPQINEKHKRIISVKYIIHIKM